MIHLFQLSLFGTGGVDYGIYRLKRVFLYKATSQHQSCATCFAVLKCSDDTGKHSLNPWCLIETLMSGITRLGFVFQTLWIVFVHEQEKISELNSGYKWSYYGQMWSGFDLMDNIQQPRCPSYFSSRVCTPGTVLSGKIECLVFTLFLDMWKCTPDSFYLSVVF